MCAGLASTQFANMKISAHVSLVLALAVCSWASGLAFAGDTAVPAEAAAFENELHGYLGLGAMYLPDYPGASSYKLQALPAVSLNYNRFFLGSVESIPTIPFALGAILYRNPEWTTGIALSYDFYSTREESSDRERLQGMGDIDRTTRASAFGRYNHDWWSASLAVTTDVGGNKEGTQVRAAVTAKYKPTEKLAFTAGPTVTWSSSQANQTYFGVDTAQSSRTGYEIYTPKAGFSEVGVGVSAMYALTRSTVVGVQAGVSLLPEVINTSPLVTSRVQTRAGMVLGYKF